MTVTFESSVPRRGICEYYTQKALADGWQASSLMMKILGRPYLPHTWTKTYPYGVGARLSWLGPGRPSPRRAAHVPPYWHSRVALRVI